MHKTRLSPTLVLWSKIGEEWQERSLVTNAGDQSGGGGENKKCPRVPIQKKKLPGITMNFSSVAGNSKKEKPHKNLIFRQKIPGKKCLLFPTETGCILVPSLPGGGLTLPRFFWFNKTGWISGMQFDKRVQSNGINFVQHF